MISQTVINLVKAASMMMGSGGVKPPGPSGSPAAAASAMPKLPAVPKMPAPAPTTAPPSAMNARSPLG